MRKMTSSKRVQGRKPIGFLIFVLILLIGVVSVQISSLYSKYIELEKQSEYLEKQIQEQLNEQMNLIEYEDYMNSSESIEEIARDKFGLIKPDEILFINQSE